VRRGEGEADYNFSSEDAPLHCLPPGIMSGYITTLYLSLVVGGTQLHWTVTLQIPRNSVTAIHNNLCRKECTIMNCGEYTLILNCTYMEFF
jgi:hypothetical protein